MFCIDHYNDCRRATGSLLPLWICVLIYMVASSVVLRSKASLPKDPSQREDMQIEEKGPWLPARDVFNPGPASKDSFLASYRSSEDV